MATYFHGGNSEMESDGLHTLYLMNPNYITAYNSASSSEHHQLQQQQQTTAANTQQQQNMILLNSVALPHAQSHSHVSHAPPSTTLQSQFLTLPFAHPISADDPSRSVNNFHYNSMNSWNSGGSGGGQVEVSGGSAVAAIHPYQIHMDSKNNDMFRRPAVVSPTTNQQGLSLTLSSQPKHGVVGGSITSSSAVQQVTVAAGIQENSNNGIMNFIIGSKYLKAAQELLDEVVNVGKVTTTETEKKGKEKVVQMDIINNEENEAGGSGGGGGSSVAAATVTELSVTQRQEIQMKKTKLISMLDEVEQRYRQYHHQMKTVVTSFEQVAGFGSARSYTSLALRTISKQFKCLKDAITSQIKEASKSLGEEDCLGVKGEGSRLRMIDHQIRQQRALHQLGMIQHNAWRPQRGLPERAVSVLRAWLFEHFLHPYPKDSDKHMLAKQTGLTRNQVSNWFINARVRLWKSMVEEMYLEEVKDNPELKGANQDTSNNNAGSSIVGKSNDLSYKQQQPSTLHVGTKVQNTSPNDISNNSTISTSPNAAASSSFQAPPPPPGFSLIGPSSDTDGLLQYKKVRGLVPETQNSPSSILSAGEISFTRHDHLNSNLTSKFGVSSVGYNMGQDHNNSTNNGVGGFGAYHHQLGELGRFNPNHHHHQMAQSFNHPNNGNVSLTLGLPHGENNLSQNYFSSQTMHGYDRRVEMVGNGGGEANDHPNNNMGFQQVDSSPHSNIGFQNMDIQNRKRYAAAAAPLLPDFVA